MADYLVAESDKCECSHVFAAHGSNGFPCAACRCTWFVLKVVSDKKEK